MTNFAIHCLCRRSLLLACAALLVSLPPPCFAQLDDSGTYTDKIYLRNGDVITGSLKELDRGKLRVKTRTMDTVFINWVDVESIDSDKYLRIERIDGSFTYGVVQRSESKNELSVVDREAEDDVPILSVSTMQPIRVEQPFWARFEGDLSAGIDYKKASDILLINLATNLRLKGEKNEYAFSANWNETSRTENDNSSRADVSGTYTRFLKERWFWKGTAGLERNEELGLDVRTLIGATAGRYLIQSPTFRLELNAGLAGNWERRQDGTTESAEGLIRSSLEIFRHSIPITRLSASVNVFPGITESGRLRVNTNVTLRNEIVRSVFWDLSFYSNYDNRPSTGASREDYGIVTSLGASF